MTSPSLAGNNERSPVACVHHWLLDARPGPDGLTRGQCKRCGSRRTFSDALPQETPVGTFARYTLQRPDALLLPFLDGEPIAVDRVA